MKVILGSRKHHYVVRASIFLITVALVWAMIGCTEVYTGAEYKLTISSTAGGSVTDPREATSNHTAGLPVRLFAQPAEGYRFVSWTGDVGNITDANGAMTEITMNGDYSITANFEKIPKYRLTVSTTDGGQVDPKEGTYTYEEKIVGKPKVVELEAQRDRDAGYGFVNWTGDVGTVADVNAASTTITMEGNYSIQANFEQEAAVNITDPSLKAAIRAATRISDGPIYPSDLKELERPIKAEANNVSDLTALEYCTSLTRLYLDDNRIDDISAVANLSRLTHLYLSGNKIDDISAVANLSRLTHLYLSGNQIDDISAVANLTSLEELYLSGNQIDDISAVANLTSLRELYLSRNGIRDITPVANLTGLEELSLGDNRINDISPLELANLSKLTLLNLSNNQISDIRPLVYNLELSDGDKIYLYDNPLGYPGYGPLSHDYDVGTYIDQLEVRGVIVEY